MNAEHVACASSAAVEVDTGATPEDKIKPAAKEENRVAPPTGLGVERVFSFAAASDVGNQEEPEARPMPQSSPADPAVKIDGDEITVTIGPRTYQVLGLEKCTSRTAMQVNVRVSWAQSSRRVAESWR